MAFDPILVAEYQSGQPVIGPGGFGQKTKENFDFLNGQIGSLEAQTILNGSFEIEDDAVAGVPANWDRTLFAGGAGAFETTAPMHGAKGYKFTHPGGGGNGGGSLESDYFAIATIRNLMLEWMHYVSAAGMHETVEVEYFTGAKVSVSTQTIYDSTSNPTSATFYQLPLVIPATARFLKVKVIGGDDDVDVAGDSFWDGVRIVFEPLRDADGDVDSAGAVLFAASMQENSKASGPGTPTKLKEIRLARGGDILVIFTQRADGAGSDAQIYRNGSPVGTLFNTAAGPIDRPELLTGWSAGDLLQLYVDVSAGRTGWVKDLKLYSRTLFGEVVTLETDV